MRLHGGIGERWCLPQNVYPNVLARHPGASDRRRPLCRRWPTQLQPFLRAISAFCDCIVWRSQGEFRLSGVPIPFDENDTPDMSEVARIAWGQNPNDPLATPN
jgi:hypothetical protein